MEAISKPALKSPFLSNILSLFPIFSLFSFFLSLFTFHSLCYALDEGGALTSLEYRSVNRESSTDRTNQYEMNSHLDAWQKVPNTGRLFFWLDWVNGKNDDRINKLGRGFLALREFRYHDFILDGLIGDSSILFTNLPEKFLNSTVPDLYFRGFQTDLLAKWGMVQVFGGKVATLEGLLGTTYNITDEFLYGFKGNFRPIPNLLLGTGFIRTQDEVDNNNQPVTKSNNIFLLDSDFEILKWMKWVTEFRRSDFKGEPGFESQNDYMLRFGPMMKTENFKLEANYRRIGMDYRFVNQATQGESDQKGFFLVAEHRPWKELTLFGNADRYSDNLEGEPDRNITENMRGLIGLSFFSPRYPSIYLTLDMSKQETRFNFPSPVDNLTSTVYSEVRYQFKDFNPYVRYRRVDYKDKIEPINEYYQNDIVLGLRRDFRQGSIVYIEGESNQKKYSDGGKETDLSGKIGFNYYISTNLSCWGEATYSKLKDRDEDTKRNTIEGAFGLTAQLPWGLQINGDIRYDKILNPEQENLKSHGIQANLGVMKRFNWGEREKIAGLKSGTETRGSGTVEGIVFNDINRNGVQDKGEEGIAGVTIRIEDGSTVKTDEKGYYRFSMVEVGGHVVTLDVKRIPAEYSIISPERVNIQVKLRETVWVNFQLIAAGSMEGRVINDVNSNGKLDPGEKGIADVLVLLQPGNNNSYTDEDGKFIFENILPGEYILKLDPVTLPEDSVFTSPEEIKILVPVGGDLKDMNFLIHVKPRPIIIGPPKN